MGGDRYSFAVLLQFIENSITRFPDLRSGKNTVYQIRDAVLSAFSVFFMQCPSFLAHQKAMGTRKGKNNAESVFGIHKIPTDTHIRNILDPISPRLLFPVFDKIFEFLVAEKVIAELVTNDNLLLIALDGTWFFSSEQIKCESCQTKNHRNGTTTYYHSAITPVIVKPEVNRVISLVPEFITVDDGTSKQDCENKAAKRWMEMIGTRYLSENYTVVLLGDDLYSRQPVCEHAITLGYSFIYVCKTSSHQYLYEWIDEFSPKELHETYDRKWNGKERVTYRYRYCTAVPLKDGENAMKLNWMELAILDKDGTVKKRFSFVTDLAITDENVKDRIAYGRSRWKIENENNNTLKTKGYHLEHNFGHGNQHLSNFLMTLNLLSYLFHTVAQIFDRRYILVRKTLSSRKMFFHDVQALTKYFFYESWDHLLQTMIVGLELEDPGG
jgi:hypothetical protein